jgi:hypothetical protein
MRDWRNWRIVLAVAGLLIAAELGVLYWLIHQPVTRLWSITLPMGGS